MKPSLIGCGLQKREHAINEVVQKEWLLLG
jgi:hypothetical protein